MSQETSKWLFTKVLIGNVLKRGTKAWHWRAARDGERSNHYDGPIPVADVHERLFSQVHAVERQLSMPNKAGVTVPVPGWKVIVNEHNEHVFRPFTDGYAIHQYSDWLIDRMMAILDDGLEIESAGLLRKDGLAWVQAALPETHQAAGGVSYRPYISGSTSHDGSLQSTFFTGATFIQCDNTLEMGLSGASTRAKTKHTGKATRGFNVTDHRAALQVMFAATKEIDAEIERMLGTKVTDAELAKFLNAYDPIAEAEGVARRKAQARHAELTTMWREDDRVAPWAGTAFGVLQLTNTWRTQVRPVRNVERADRVMQDVILGQGQKDDADAMRTLAKVLV